jgi:hypothetical protein
MNRFFLPVVVSVLFAASPLLAQPGADELDDVLSAASAMKAEIQLNGSSLRSLVNDFIILPIASPDPAPFVVTTATSQAAIEVLANDIISDIAQANSADAYSDPAAIQALASQIISLGDAIESQSLVLAGYVNAGDLPNGTAAAIQLRTDLTQQFQWLRQIVSDTREWQQALFQYNVRIVLVDNAGNPIIGSTGLMGFYAYNTFTDEYTYPDFLFNDEFSDIRGGNWTFGAFNGYFDGASSNNVTLDASLEGPDGFIPVTLVYWSE